MSIFDNISLYQDTLNSNRSYSPLGISNSPLFNDVSNSALFNTAAESYSLGDYNAPTNYSLGNYSLGDTSLTGKQSGGGFFSSLFGNKNAQGMSGLGMAGTAINLGTSALKAYVGLKQLGVMQDSLDFQKDSFSKQFEIQRKQINSAYRDKQRYRLAAARGRTDNMLSLEDYMAEHQI